jgi:hypothetical protein
MLPSPHEHTAGGGATTPPAVLNPVVATAVALTQGAALAAVMGAVASWNPLAYLDAAADRAWRLLVVTPSRTGAPAPAATVPASARRCCLPRPPSADRWLTAAT